MLRFISKLFILHILVSSFIFQGIAQELDCKVSVVSQKITGVDNAVFRRLENNLTEILNTTDWTNQKFDSQEKIKCNFILTLEAKTDENIFEASLQVQAYRPVFESSYDTPLLNHKDKQVTFSFLPNESLQYTAGGRNNELVAVIAYYAYLIIGLDADSFSKFGGTKALKKAQQIVQYQTQGTENGWAATERNINRYWIVEDLLNYKDLRATIYQYHREGLDKMANAPREGMENLLESIKELKSVHEKSTNGAAMHVFFDAKANEITQSVAAFPEKKRKKIFSLLAKIDPGHLGIYKTIE